MKKEKLLLVFFGTVLFGIILFIVLYDFYLPRIKFYRPIDIAVIGPSKNNPLPIQIYGITPLGRKSVVDKSRLSQPGDKPLLFSELFIDLRSAQIDSISQIVVQYNGHKSIIGKNEIAQWYDQNKAHPFFPLASYSGVEDGNLPKLRSMLSIDWRASAWHFIMSRLRPVTGFFYKIIPFLLVTIIFPSFCILLMLIKTPIAEYRIVIRQTGLAKAVFFICLFFFLCMQVYGIYYYKLRLQGVDAVNDMIAYSSTPVSLLELPGTHRFANILNKVFLLPAVKFRLPLNMVGRIFCLNDACFYLFITALILFFTKRYDLAAVVLAAPVMLSGINYYYINNELFLSGSLMILYVAISQGLKDSILKKLILFPCLFFIIWSHPATIIMLGIFLTGTYKSGAQIVRDKWTLIFIMINIGIRSQFMDAYDQNNMHELKGDLSFSYLLYFIATYCETYWYILLLVTGGIYITLTEEKTVADYAGLLVFPLLVYFCMSQKLLVSDEHFAKFIYPANLFILMSGMVIIARKFTGYQKIILVIITIAQFSAISDIFSKYHPLFKKEVAMAEILNKICRKEGPQRSKWFVRGDKLNMLAGSESDMESVLLSAYRGDSITIMVVRNNQVIDKILDTLPESGDQNNDELSASLKSLNPYYFHLREGPYKELTLDSARLALIQMACQ